MSERFCINCEEITNFGIDYGNGESYCDDCGVNQDTSLPAKCPECGAKTEHADDYDVEEDVCINCLKEVKYVGKKV